MRCASYSRGGRVAAACLVAAFEALGVLVGEHALAIDVKPDYQAIAPILEKIGSASPEVRLKAVKELGRLEWPDDPQKAIAALASVLQGDKDLSIRAAAAEALGQGSWGLWTADATPALTREVSNPNPVVAAAAIRALGRLHRDLPPHSVLPAIRHQNPEVRLAAAEAIGILVPHAEVRDGLLAALADENAAVRAAAAWSLRSFLDDPKVREAMIQALEKNEPRVRGNAAVSLIPYARADKRIIAALLDMLDDESKIARSNAAYALGEARVKEAAETLCARFAKETDPHVRRTVATVLGKLADRRAVDVLIPALELGRTREGFEVAVAAADALAALGDARAVEPLLRSIEGGEPHYQSRAVCALLVLDPGKCVGPCSRLFAAPSTSSEYRGEYADVLGKTKDPQARQALLDALRGNDPVRRRLAARSLGPFGKAALDPLLEAIEDEDAWVAAGAVKSLGAIDDPRVLPAVLKAFRDNRTVVWQAAREVLRRRNLPQAEGRTPDSAGPP